MYFNQQSLEGFANAVAGRLGITVNYAVGSPCTDGTTVTLPLVSGSMTEFEFRGLCATAIHEAAHVFFKSCYEHVRFQKLPGSPRIRAAAYNCVIDVVDETAIMSFLPGAQRLLNDHILQTIDQIGRAHV